MIRDLSVMTARLCVSFDLNSKSTVKNLGIEFIYLFINSQVHLISGLIQIGGWGIFNGLLKLTPANLSIASEYFRFEKV